MFKLTSEQLKEYRKSMEERIKKATKEDHIIHGYMIYQCIDCEKVYIMNLERGLEDPTYDVETGSHKQIPLRFPCITCGGNAFDVSWDRFKDTLGKDYRSYTEMVNSPGFVCRNFFWNDPESDCGVPVIFESDGYVLVLDTGLSTEECSSKRHVVHVPLKYFTKESPDLEGGD